MMFAKFKQWFCSKVCQPKYDAAQIRDDLTDIINDIDDKPITYKQMLYESAKRDMYRDYHDWQKK